MKEIEEEQPQKVIELTRWAVHKRGTEQLGYLCFSKKEAELVLKELKDGISNTNMQDNEKAEYQVVEVKVQFTES